MLHVIFGFFGASVGAAFGFVIGMFEPQWFYRSLGDGQGGPFSVVNNYSVGWLLGGLLGGIAGLLFARKINRKT